MPTTSDGENESDSDSAAEPSYGYKPSPMGAPLEFRLTPAALEWRHGGQAGRIPYDRIRRIRLQFRPTTIHRNRFVMQVWPERGSRLEIASTSWRTLVDHERHDRAYVAFVTELNRRVAKAGGSPLLQTGSPPPLYWAGVVVLALMALVLVISVGRLLLSGAWSAAALLAAFFGLVLWQMGSFFRRNRPGTYRPDAVPDQVLPRV
jgi:hypothetical protein